MFGVDASTTGHSTKPENWYSRQGDDWKCPTCSKSPANVFVQKMPAPMTTES